MKAQAAINRLLFSAFQSTLLRKISRSLRKGSKRARTQVYKNKKRLEINSLLENLNVLTISERADWTRAKNVLKFSTSEVEDLAKVYQFSERKVRSMPLLNVLRSNSETLRKSVKFKSISFWNSLPRNWNLDDHRSTQGQGFRFSSL